MSSSPYFVKNPGFPPLEGVVAVRCKYAYVRISNIEPACHYLLGMDLKEWRIRPAHLVREQIRPGDIVLISFDKLGQITDVIVRK